MDGERGRKGEITVGDERLEVCVIPMSKTSEKVMNVREADNYDLLVRCGIVDLLWGLERLIIEIRQIEFNILMHSRSQIWLIEEMKIFISRGK